MQEAINNATRHGRADEIRIGLRVDGEKASLTVVDSGGGMSTTDGLGLSIMTYRARLIGGSLSITEPEEGGTEVTCIFPHETWPAEEHDAAA